MKRKFQLLGLGAGFLCACLLFSLFSQAISLAAPPTRQTTAKTAPIIVLDAGHGGEDGGAVGVSGVAEKDLNLALCGRLAALFRMAGVTVVETRSTDTLLCAPDTKKGHRKQADLSNRLKIAAQYPESVFVSIHMNTFPTADCKGLQVWYSQNDKRSYELASAIRESNKALLEPQNNRKVKAATSSIYLLQNARTPAVLIECGFISHPEDCAKLSSEDYQSKLALVIFSALMKKFENATCDSP